MLPKGNRFRGVPDPIFLSFRSGARHRSRDFAAATRLPASLRSAKRSRAAGLDPFQLLGAHRSWIGMRPTPFNRLLQSNRTASTTTVRPSPAPPLARSPAEQLLPDLARRFHAVRVTGAQVAACPVRRRAFVRRRESSSSCPSPVKADRPLEQLGPKPAESSRARGRTGSPRGPASAFRSRSLAPEASPQPDRLEHLLSLARCPRRGDVRSAGAFAPCPKTIRARPATWPLYATCRLVGPPLVASREGDRDPLHPRCFPSKEELPEGAWPSSPTCPQGVDSGPTPLRSRSLPNP